MTKLLPLPIFLLILLSACTPVEKPEPVDPIQAKANEVYSAYRFEPVAKNTWVMHGPLEMPSAANRGFMNNPGLVSTSAGLVLIDPGSSVYVGRYVLQQIKAISEAPVVAVFNTHIHGDHWLANDAIKAAYPNVKIYGHPNMRQAADEGEGQYWVDLLDRMTEGATKGTRVVTPDQNADNSDIVTIGDTRFRIHHYGVAHTNGDIMIEVVENSVVFLGDNVLAKRLPRMSDGTFRGSIDSINKILETGAETWVPGHGKTGSDHLVKSYLNYITLVYAAAKEAFDNDLDSSDVIKISRRTTTAFKDWAAYDEMLGPHGAQAYAEVEAAEF